jgi:hypothetical protein
LEQKIRAQYVISLANLLYYVFYKIERKRVARQIIINSGGGSVCDKDKEKGCKEGIREARVY